MAVDDTLFPHSSRQRPATARTVREAPPPCSPTGPGEASDALFAELYSRIRREAHRQILRERPGGTIQATELLHEAYLRLQKSDCEPCEDRTHFVRLVGRTMHRVLIDLARRRRAEKRGGKLERVPLVTLGEGTRLDPEDLISLDDALKRLSEGPGNGAREARVMELHFFGGATAAEIAQALGVTERTVQRDFAHARVWLRREIGI